MILSQFKLHTLAGNSFIYSHIITRDINRKYAFDSEYDRVDHGFLMIKKEKLLYE
jgi:hypothetical protein